MYLYKNSDGSIVPAPADFSPESPDFEALAEVEEVLFVSKIYVKQLRLVVKPKEERDAIRSVMERDLPSPENETENEPEAHAPEEDKKPRRGKKGN